jgi:cob(I)alamin adenosyltransferase
MVQVYTGNGKGKTTAALGLIVRALGRKKKACLIQFMKKNFEYGEIRFLENISNIDIFQFGTDKLVDPNNPADIDFKEASAALEKVYAVLKSDNYDLVVVDEINVAVKWGLIDPIDQIKIFDIKTKAEIVMTGRGASPELIDKADLVTEMKEVKHYYNQGVQARKGIEF